MFRRYGDTYRDQAGASLSTAQRRVMTAIERCRTAALGGHVEQCDTCGHTRVAFNSCRESALSASASRWHAPPGSRTARRTSSTVELLPRRLHRPRRSRGDRVQNKAVVYGILFQATAETLRTIAADPKHLGAEIGFFAVLHTLGTDAGASSASPLRRPRRRPLDRRHSAGSPADRASFCRSACCPASSAVCSLDTCKTRSTRANCGSRVRSRPCPITRSLPIICGRRGRLSGWCTRNRPLLVPNRSSTTSAATPIGSPSPTIGCSTWRTARSASGTRITATDRPEAQKTMALPPRNSSGGFSCTCYRQASTAFGTTACSGIATPREARPMPAAPRRHRADHDCPRPRPRQDYRDRYEALTGISLRMCPVVSVKVTCS